MMNQNRPRLETSGNQSPLPRCECDLAAMPNRLEGFER
jgi:hypothetical protein